MVCSKRIFDEFMNYFMNSLMNSMAQAKLTDRSIRKLSKVASGNSYSVTIPIDIVRAMKWKERQRLVITREGRHVVIKDWRA